MKSSKKYSLATCTTLLALSISLAGTVQGQGSVTIQENIDQLKKTKSCRDCDLSGANLNRFDLEGADLENADLSSATFFLANLTGANLRNATLTGAVFGGADLSDADLRGADLRGASIDTAYLVGAQMEGKFVATKPYEKAGIEEIEKEVFVEDQSKSKKSPEAREVKVGSRRDFGDQPPAIEEDPTSSSVNNMGQPVAEIAELPKAPSAKKIAPPREVVIEEEPDQDVVVEKEMPQLEEKKAELLSTEEVVEQDNPQVTSNKTAVERTAEVKGVSATSPVSKVEQQVATSVVVESERVEQATNDVIEEVTAKSGDLAMDKAKRDNMTRLLDKNKCYECDLAGLDLSGKKLKMADLEKADLTGCNLEKADLRKANLKGAQLAGANLRGARLDKADFYKADLTGADLTGADTSKALFDGATVVDALGYEGSANLWKAQ